MTQKEPTNAVANGEFGEDFFDHLPIPALRGFLHDGVPFAETVNRAFSAVWGQRVLLPCAVEALFAGIPGPRRFDVMESAAATPGWHQCLWEIVPGERFADLAVHAGEDGRFLALVPECTEHMIVRRLNTLREKIGFLLRSHHVREVFSPLAGGLTDFFGLDWVGVLKWSSTELRWSALVSEPHPVLLARDPESVTAFLDHIQADEYGEISGSRLGGLLVQEGEEWWVRWPEEAGTWRKALDVSGIQSLFAGTLLVGAHPMVLMALSRREGTMGRVNGDVLRALWPTLCSTAERYRAVMAMSALAELDGDTGLMAISPLRRHLQQELRRSRRYGYPLSLIRLVLHNAEALAEGDPEALADTLRTMGREVGQNIRTVDVAGRIDQRSLLLLLPHTDLPGREVVAQRLRDRLSLLSPSPYIAPDIRITAMTFLGESTPVNLEEALGTLDER